MASDFKASTHGFHFPNDWPAVPDLTIHVPLIGTLGFGDASMGLCGGMTYAAADYYFAGLPVPAMKDNPEPGSPLFEFIRQRFLDSVDIPVGILKAYGWMSHPGDLSSRTFRHETDGILADLREGLVVPITLIKVESIDPRQGGHNHQVLAYDALWSSASIVLSIYDNNYPDDDGQTITISDGHIECTGYDVIRGFYANHYTPAVPPTQE